MHVIGWLSSLILLLTITNQIRAQWKSGSTKGVSVWLYVGQLFASLGFSIYSAFVHDWVFIVTNLLMLLSAAVGLAIYGVQKRRVRKKKTDDERDDWRRLVVPKEGLEPSRT